MNRKDLIFKIAIPLVCIVEIAVLIWGVAVVAVEEYDPVHHETIGIALIILTTTIACAMFLVIIYNMIRWKPDQETSMPANTVQRSLFSFSPRPTAQTIP